MATVLIGSPEFQTRFGSLSNQQFVEQLYRFVLDREGDAANDLVPIDGALTGSWMLTDTLFPTDVLSGNHHRSDWMQAADGLRARAPSAPDRRRRSRGP